METYIRNGRTFTVIGLEPYTRRDGKQVMLKIWSCPCKRQDCTEPIIVKVSANADLNAAKIFDVVHCKAHRITPKEFLSRGAAATRRLSDADVVEIRALKAKGFHNEDIALVFPVSAGTVREIASGRRR